MDTRIKTLAHLFATFNQVQNIVVLLDQKGRCIYLNEAANSHLGYPPEMRNGFSITQLCPTIVSEREFQTQLLSPAKHKGPFQLSHTYNDYSGQVLPVSSLVSIVDTKYQTLLCLTSSKIANEENYELENMSKILERTQRVAKLGSWYLDLNQNKLTWSKVTYDIHELPAQTSVGVETGINFYVPEHKPIITKYVEDGINLKKPWDVELQIITAKGTRKWVRAIGNPIIENNQTIGLEGTFQDIHNHKLLELEQEKVVTRLKKMEVISKMGHWELTLNPTSVTWSEGLFLLLDLDPSQSAPSIQEYLKWVHPDDQALFYETLMENISSQTPYSLVVRTYVNDEIKYLKGEAKPTFDAQGNLVGFFGTTIDITEQKQTEQRLLDSNTSLEVANEELSQFAYRTSHDLKAPLSSIKGLSRLISMDIESNSFEDVKNNVNHIYKQANKLGKLIENILDLARADLKVSQVETINLLSLVNNIKQDYLYLLDNYKVELIIDIPAQLTFKTLYTPIQQIMINLIVNGIKYSNHNRENRFVKVKVIQENDVKIIVSDNGIGIPKKSIHTIFELFTRLHPQHCDGSGLGLAIVKKHLHVLNGSIDIESDHNGSIFALSLPARGNP